MATDEARTSAYWTSLAAWCRSRTTCRTFMCPGVDTCELCITAFSVKWNTMCNTLLYYGYLDIEQFASREYYEMWLAGFDTWWRTYSDPWAPHAVDLGTLQRTADLEMYEYSRKPRDDSYGRVREYRDVRPKDARWIAADGTSIVNYMPPLSTVREPIYEANCAHDVKIAVSTHATAKIDKRLQAQHRAERAEAFIQEALRVVYDPDPICDHTVSIMFIADRDAYRRASLAVVKELMIRRKAAQLFTPEITTVSSGSGVLTRVDRASKASYRTFAIIHRDSTFTRLAAEGVLRVAGAIVTGAYAGRINWREEVPGGDPVKYAVSLLVGQTFNSYNLGAREVTWWRSISEKEYLEANPPTRVYQTSRGLVGLKRALQNKRLASPDYHKFEQTDEYQRIVACYKRVAVLKLTDAENAVFARLERDIDDFKAMARFVEEIYTANSIPPELQDLVPKLVSVGPQIKSIDGVPVEVVAGNGVLAH